MPSIAKLSFIGLEHELPPERAFGMARGIGHRRPAGIVEIETSDGVAGVGEVFGNPFVSREYFRMVEPFFAGRSVFDFDHIEAEIRNRTYHLGVQNQLTACLAGINVALLDAIGHTTSTRVCDLIGGCRSTRLPVYASTGFFSRDVDRQLEHMLAEVKAHPYIGIKIKIGRGARDDVARVKQTREALGDDILLIVDINGNYTVDLALESMRAIEPYNIHWVEEPLPPSDLRGYAELRARAPIPIAAGEAHYAVRDFKQLIDGRCLDIVQPAIPTVGGLTEAKRIAFLAQASNLRVSPHVWGGALGLTAACHFVASLPSSPHTDNVPYPTLIEYDMSANALRTDLLASPIRLDAGHLILPDGPGLGVTLDRGQVERYRVC